MTDAKQTPTAAGKLGVIVIDHGSRRPESNAALLEAVKLFQSMGRYRIVEPAHMELAEPSLQTAFDRCLARGARLIVVQPYFLFPGRHWRDDLPRLTQAAARRHPGVSFLVAAPLGVHPLMSQIMHERISHCLAHAQGLADACSVCRDTRQCQFGEADAPDRD